MAAVEVPVMGKVAPVNARYIEVNADDARHFGYIGPNGFYRFLSKTLLPGMEEPINKELFAEAFVDGEWVECLAGAGVPNNTRLIRLYPPAIQHFIDMADFDGAESLFVHFVNDYLRHLSCP